MTPTDPRALLPRPPAYVSYDWADQALCRTSENPDAWTDDQPNIRFIAARICLSCPVMDDCYNVARQRKEHWGVWGGVDFGADKRRLPNPARRCEKCKTLIGHMVKQARRCESCTVPDRHRDRKKAS